MQWGSLLLCSWPGLPGLWYRGQWTSLLLAIGFSLLLNVALVSSFIWPWILGETFPAIAWPALIVVWVTSTWVGQRRLPDLMAAPRGEKVAELRTGDTLFIQAQDEYLRGHWEAAAGLLERQLHQQPRDVEARLLLATLLRHRREFQQARFHLGELAKLDAATEWQFEMQQEHELLRQIENDIEETEETSPQEPAGSLRQDAA